MKKWRLFSYYFVLAPKISNQKTGGLSCFQLRKAAHYILGKRNSICMHPRSCCRRPARPLRPLLRIGWPPRLACVFATPPCGHNSRGSYTEPSQPFGRCGFALVPKISNLSETERFRSILGHRPQGLFSGRASIRDGVGWSPYDGKNSTFFSLLPFRAINRGCKGEMGSNRTEGKAEGRRGEGRAGGGEDFSGFSNAVPSRLHAGIRLKVSSPMGRPTVPHPMGLLELDPGRTKTKTSLGSGGCQGTPKRSIGSATSVSPNCVSRRLDCKHPLGRT